MTTKVLIGRLQIEPHHDLGQTETQSPIYITKKFILPKIKSYCEIEKINKSMRTLVFAVMKVTLKEEEHKGLQHYILFFLGKTYKIYVIF